VPIEGGRVRKKIKNKKGFLMQMCKRERIYKRGDERVRKKIKNNEGFQM
jgi:hypothetical protein